MSDRGEFVEIQFEALVRETDGAFCFRIDDMDRWIPRSLTGEIDQDRQVVEVKDWYAYKEGLM